MWNEILHPSRTRFSKLSHHLEGYDQQTGMLVNIWSLFRFYGLLASSETFLYLIVVAGTNICLSINVNAVRLGRWR
jgi:hypothetical protein